jgi:hypothetical protein
MRVMVRLLTTGAATCAVALLLTACASPDQPSAPGPSGLDVDSAPRRISPPVVAPTVVPGFDYSEPGPVCRAFATTVLAQDATIQGGPQDAFRSAGAYMVEPVIATGPGRGDAGWSELVAHDARIDVQIEDWAGELPADQPTTAFRAVLATTTPIGADGWSGVAQIHAVYCSLYRVDSGWRVSDYSIEYLADIEAR